MKNTSKNANGNSLCGIHLLSPYIGKIRPALARHLISEYSPKNSIIVDPFCGSGTIPLEGWILNRRVYGNDLNPYAVLLTKGKLYPPKSLKTTQRKLDKINKLIPRLISDISIKELPSWVKQFYHRKTLKEILVWSKCLLESKEYFLLSNLMGILHHQRPGFLSFPSSHGAPYLRSNKFPKESFPDFYKYRNVYERLSAKVIRSFKNFPSLDFAIKRSVSSKCASTFSPRYSESNTIITSPPYMKSLTYARDNRLRLWFMGYHDHKTIEKMVSPNKMAFKSIIEDSLPHWNRIQKKGDKCIVIIGSMDFDKKTTLSDFVQATAEHNGYSVYDIIHDPIPYDRRFVKKDSKIKSEEIIILSKEK